MHSVFRSLLGVALMAGAASAQSLYEVEGFGTFQAHEFTGPPAACAYPNGPLLFSFPYMQPVPCFPLNPIPAGTVIGDITDHMIKDLVYVADDKSVGEYLAATGVQTNIIPVAGVFGTGPLTGLGFNGAANILWVTDGATIFGITPPPSGSCAFPALATPMFAHVGPGIATDVAWVPALGIVVVCDTLGFVTGYTPVGAVSIAPFFAAGTCGLGPALFGIAADTSTGCSSPQVISLTDGLNVSRVFLFGGGPAPPTFYQTATCSPLVLPFGAGLAYAARPIHYGVGSGPISTSTGQSCLPSPAFSLGVTGGPPGGTAFLLVGLVAPCPNLNLLGQPLLVFPINSINGPFPMTAAGTFSFPAPLPPPGGPIPCGLRVFTQWFLKSTTNVWTSSDGLHFSFSLP
jgi:hypothetical protein